MSPWIGLCFAAALMGCAKGRLPSDPLEPTRYALDLSLSYDSEARAAPPELQAKLASLASGEETLSMVILWQEGPGHRDGSQSVWVRFEEARLRVDEAEQELGLEGRSVELRRFGDGEILDVSDADHIAGGDRQGEVLDLLWPLLSPHPPDLRPGKVVRREARWPLRIDAERGQRGLLTAGWRYLEAERVDGERRHHVAYDGTWTTLGSDRTRDVPRGIRAEGTASGELWVDTELALLRHDFDWERTVTLRGPAFEEGERHELSQTQRFSGQIRRLP